MIRDALKKWLGVFDLESENKRLKLIISKQVDRITNRISELDKLTEVDVDIGARGPCTVILSGVFRGRGYVSFYEMDHEEFEYMVDEFRHRRKSGHLRNIDRIPDYRGGGFIL